MAARHTLRNAFCATPTITGFTPTGGNAGVVVTVNGRNFDPGAVVSLGGGPPRPTTWIGATQVQTTILPEDTAGQITVVNTCDGLDGRHASPDNVFTTSVAEADWFVPIELDIEHIALNQGIESHGLVEGKPTLVQAFLSRTVTPRTTDALQVDRIRISYTTPDFILEETGLPWTRVEEVDVDSPSAVPSFRTFDTALLEASPTPSLRSLDPGPRGFVEGRVQVSIELLAGPRNALVVAAEQQFTHVQSLRSEAALNVLLVPIMRHGYAANELDHMREDVDGNLDQLRERIWPTGRVNTFWADTTFTPRGILSGINKGDRISIGDPLEFYDASHSLDRARRWYNTRNEPDVSIVIGVIQGVDESTFNGATDVVVGANTLFLPNDHDFVEGQPVTYRVGENGTAVGNLQDNETYFVVTDPANSRFIRLADTRSDAMSGIVRPLTAAGVGEEHTLTAPFAFEPGESATGLGYDPGLNDGAAEVGTFALDFLDYLCDNRADPLIGPLLTAASGGTSPHRFV